MTDSQGQAGALDSQSNVVEFPRHTQACMGIPALERINQFDFYQLARKLGALNQFKDDEPIDQNAAFWVAYWGQSHMDSILAGDPIELGVSRAKAQVLRENIAELIKRHFTGWDENFKAEWKFPVDDAPPLPAWEWGSIRTGLADFELVFAEELREGATYRVPSRGIYNTRKLVDEAECTFPPDVEGHVPAGAKLEWRAAGRCLAFGMFTACGFHVARAVEVMLEAYFHVFNDGPDKKLKNWGQYLDSLEKIAEAGGVLIPGPKTMGELKQHKDDWRNPLMHPRVVLEEADARAVFNNGETLVMMMAQELAAAALVAGPTLQLIAVAAASDAS